MSSSGVAEEGVGVAFSGAILTVISESWASNEVAVEKASGREMVRFTVRWKARRSCLRRAVRVWEGVVRISFAWRRSDWRVSLVDLAGAVDSGGGGEVVV